MERRRTVRLYGLLGARFGRVHRLVVASAAEAVRALSVLLPGFERELMTSGDRGVRYAVFLGRRNLQSADLADPAGDDEIRIAPILQGSKSGLFAVVLGAALIAFAASNPFGLAAMTVTATSAATWGSVALGLGTSLALSGVAQLLTQQQQGLASASAATDNGASYNFNGPVNTSQQGLPVPLVYGEMLVGSAVISAGIYAEDQA